MEDKDVLVWTSCDQSVWKTRMYEGWMNSRLLNVRKSPIFLKNSLNDTEVGSWNISVCILSIQDLPSRINASV